MTVIEERQHYIAVLDETGDTKTTWDPDKPEEVEMARETFNTLRKKGYAIFRSDARGKKAEQMHTFDSEAAALIAVKGIQAG